jgi:hypothetical protein
MAAQELKVENISWWRHFEVLKKITFTIFDVFKLKVSNDSIKS